MDVGPGFVCAALRTVFGTVIAQLRRLGIDLPRIGRGFLLTVIGAFIFWLGVTLLFNWPLLAIGNVLVVVGPIYTLGTERTLCFLSNEDNRMASVCFIGGFCLLVFGQWRTVGIPLEIYGIFLLIQQYLPGDPIKYLVGVLAKFLGMELEEHEKSATSKFIWSSIFLRLGLKKLGHIGLVFGFAQLLYKSKFPFRYKMMATSVFTFGEAFLLAGWFGVGLLVVSCAHILLTRSVVERLINFLKMWPVLRSIFSHPFVEQFLRHIEDNTPGSQQSIGNEVESTSQQGT
ncbi:uncharacterized protein LOC110974974 [Acanthaster planci]|uniref:Uncharacterized protein LOC110974974 n=1 Tax=Acanthaster planci TaxID=133434 RepID=A0A8B7XPB2_ACAPL|nr:uncharacterized protein LOC110974974 [Acanthaster planci]